MTDVVVATVTTTVAVAPPATSVVETSRPRMGDMVFAKKDFLAKADDVTNDSARLQACWDAAYQVGLPVWHEPGSYRATNLRPNPGQVLLGPNGGGHGILLATGKHARINQIAGTNDHLIRGVQGAAHVVIQGLHLDGNKNNNLTAGSAIYLDDVGTPEEAQWRIEGCFIEAAREFGIYVGSGRRAVKISQKCVVNYHGASGVRFSGSDGAISGCILGSNGVDGLQVGAAVTRVADCDIYGNAATGINVLSTINQIMIRGNGIDRNGTHGIFLGSGAAAISVMGNDLHSNSQNVNGGAHHINVATTTGLVAILGNVFGVDSGMTRAAGYCIFHASGATSERFGNEMMAGAANLGLNN